MMLPLLHLAQDGVEHDVDSAVDHIAAHFNLTPAERDDALPSGTNRLENRVGWCRTHLKHAGLIEYVKRGIFKITARGQEVLAKNPKGINLKFLDQFPEHFKWFHQAKSKAGPPKYARGTNVCASNGSERKIGRRLARAHQSDEPLPFRATGCGPSSSHGLRRIAGGSRDGYAEIERRGH